MRLIVTPCGGLTLPAMTLGEYRAWLYHNPTVAHAVVPIRAVP